MSDQLYDVLTAALRTFYLIAAPTVLVIFVAGSIASILQSAMSIQDATMSYAVRLIAFVVLLYLILPTIVHSMTDLAEFAFR